MNLGHAGLWLQDPQAALEQLENDLIRFREESDLAGLASAEQLALTVSSGASGRIRRRAEKLAEAARSTIDELERAAAERERVAEEARASEATARSQFGATLHLLLNDGRDPTGVITTLLSLASADEDKGATVDADSTFDAWFPLILTGYEHSQRIFSSLMVNPSDDERKAIERRLKSLAVELMAAGATLKGLTIDAVPLIAYGLFNGELPVAPESTSPSTLEKIDDVLLSMADGVSELGVGERRLFVALFQIGILLGQAQAYARQFALGSVAIFETTRTDR